MDPKVHAYVSTGLANSKFGIRNSHLQVRQPLPRHPGLLYVALWQACGWVLPHWLQICMLLRSL